MNQIFTELSDIMNGKAYELKRSILDIIDLVADNSIEVRLQENMCILRANDGSAQMFYLDYDSCFDAEDNQVRDIIEYLADQMSEQDYPVSKFQANKFCDLFGVNKEERSLIMSRASSNEAYCDWKDEEARKYSY